MSHAFIATATPMGTIAFKSDTHRDAFKVFLKNNAGKDIGIGLAKKAVSEEMRGYYFAAVLPVLRKTCKEWENLTPDELHAVVKKEFAHFEAYSAKNKRIERFAKDVFSADNNEVAKQFLMDIADYLAGCGMEMPDPQSWAKWRDSAPLKDEEYNQQEHE